MKTGNSLTTRSHYIQKGVAAPGLGVAVFFRPRAQSSPGGPGPPCCMNVGSGDAVPADFHDEKIGKFSGGLGAKPPASLCVLSPRGERTWPRIGYPFSLGQRFICADKLQHALQKRVWPAGPFFTQRKGEKKRQGEPPWNPPGILIFRAIVGHHNGR